MMEEKWGKIALALGLLSIFLIFLPYVFPPSVHISYVKIEQGGPLNHSVTYMPVIPILMGFFGFLIAISSYFYRDRNRWLTYGIIVCLLSILLGLLMTWTVIS